MIPDCAAASPNSDADSVALESVRSNGSNHSSWSQWSSQFSVNFKTRFQWLLTKHDNEFFRQEKEREIIECLTGNDNEEVDLWKLRELALQRGGLMCSSLRKRVWPKLVAAHEQVLRHAANADQAFSFVTSQHLVELSRNDVNLLNKEAAHCVWSMEDHFRQQKALAKKEQSRKLVSFAVSTTEAVQLNDIALDLDEMEVIDSNGLGRHKSPISGNSGTWSPQSHGTLESFTLSTRATRWSRPSLQEQRVLYNVISSVLRIMPDDDSPYFEDDRYHYYSGFQNLTAIMLINLESPSLTSLVLGQLMKQHLRDATRRIPEQASKSILQQAVDVVFMPLLQQVDADVHDHLLTSQPSSLVTTWVATWFCQDVAHVAVASRLVDVFLVSHALMPLYFATALIASNRSQILQIDPSSLSSLYSTLRGLPLKLGSRNGANNLEAMTPVEELIESAVSYMSRIPPKQLLQESSQYHRRRGNPISNVTKASVAFFHDQPHWMTAPVAPTDWALLQQAKAIRNSDGFTQSRAENKKSVKSVAEAQKRYPLASAAAGVTSTSSLVSSNFAKLLVLLTLLVCGTVAIVTGIHPHSSGKRARSAASPQLLLGFDSLQHFRRLVLSEEPNLFSLYLQRRLRQISNELHQERSAPLALPAPASSTSISDAVLTALTSSLEIATQFFIEESNVQAEEIVASNFNQVEDHECSNLALEPLKGIRKFLPKIFRQSFRKLKLEYVWVHVRSWLKSAGNFFR